MLSFITNNVKGIQSSKKRLKLIRCFKDKVGTTGVLSLQETHSTSKMEQKWKETLKIKLPFFTEKKFLQCPNYLLWKRKFFC